MNKAQRKKERQRQKKKEQERRRIFEGEGHGVGVYKKGKLVQLVSGAHDMDHQLEFGSNKRKHEGAQRKLGKIDEQISIYRHRYNHLYKSLREAGALGSVNKNAGHLAHLGGATILTNAKDQSRHKELLEVKAKIELLENERNNIAVDSLVTKNTLAKYEGDVLLNVPKDAATVIHEHRTVRMAQWREQWNEVVPIHEMTGEQKTRKHQNDRRRDAKRRLSTFSKSVGVKASYRETREKRKREKHSLVSKTKQNEKNLSRRFKERRKIEAVVNIMEDDARIRKRIDDRYKELCRPQRKVTKDIDEDSQPTGMWDDVSGVIKQEKAGMMQKMIDTHDKAEELKAQLEREGRERKEKAGFLPKIKAAQQSMKDATSGLLSSISDLTPTHKIIRDAKKGLMKSVGMYQGS
jgi:hypothetical protein